MIVNKSLQNVDELHGTSVAFPAIGTGNLRFPPAETARIMLEETVRYCLSNPKASVKDIRFLLLQRNGEVIEAFTKEMNRQQKLHSQVSVPQTGGETWYRNFEIVQGDLTKESQTDAIFNVLASDMNMARAGSLSADVRRAAGNSLEVEFRGCLQQCERPKAAITSGGKLQVPYVIHIIPSSSSASDIKESLEIGLDLAKQHSILSVSIPAVGTGCYGLPASKSASIIFEAFRNVWGSYTQCPKVRIVINQVNLISAFELAKEKHFVPVTVESGCRRNAKMEQLIIEVIHGDLTDEESDAIVNIINPDMEMDNAGEVSKAISQVCGSNVKQECKQMAPQKGGSVVVTSGGDLKVRHIIHLIPESSDAKHLQTCLEKCLRLADSKEFRSVSLPAIGTGGYGMSPVISANLIFQALSSFCRICAKVRNVRIVIKQMPMVEAFRQEQKRHEETSSTVVSTEFRTQAVRVKFTGKDKGSVYKAIDELSNDLSENCTVEKLEDEGISKLSESQIHMLIKSADDCDVEMTVDAATGSVILRGSRDEVHDMTKMIMQNINQARETEKKKFEHENARMISKTIQWNFELQGKKTPFDFKANLEIEKAYSNGDKTVKVSSRGVDFVIDIYNNSGYQQPQNQQITVTRKLKEAEGKTEMNIITTFELRLLYTYTPQ